MMLSGSAAQPATVAPRKSLRESRLISEHVLQAQLDDAIPAAAEDFAGSCVWRPAIPSIGDGRRRGSQIEMIECVQKIGAELQPVLFRYRDELLHSYIPVPGAGTIHRIPLDV